MTFYSPSMRNKGFYFIAFLALSVPLLLIVGRAVADIAMGVVSLAFLTSMITAREWKWIKTPWFMLALATYIYMVVSALFADFDRAEALKSSLPWLRFPIFAIAFATWILPHDKIRRVLAPALIVLIVAVALDTLCQFVFGISLSGHVKPDYPGRLTGPFNRLVPGVYLLRLVWPAIGFLFAWAATKPEDRKRVAGALAFIALTGVTILISGERIAFVVFCLCAFFFWLGAKNMRVILGACGAAGIALAVGLVVLIPSLHDRLVTRTMPYLEDLQASPYGAVWHNGWMAWKSSPILGVGRNNFVPMCEKRGKASGFVNEIPGEGELHCVRHPHNVYLEWAAETGLIGLALFIALACMWIGQAWRNLRATDGMSITDYYNRLGLLVGLVPFLWPIMSSMSFFTNWSAVLFWWVLALSLRSLGDIKAGD